MAVDQAFIDRVSELFAFLPELRTRRMFGALGVYSGELFFAVAGDGEVWLKVDDGNRARFEAAGAQPFTFTGKDGKIEVMSYRRMPEESWDDEDAARDWSRLALDAALRARAKPGGRKR